MRAGKKTNGKAKGNRVELELCKILSARFGRPFVRAVGSGNRWGQVSNLPKHAKDTLTGDICPPEGFSWVIECKGGYDREIDLNNLGEPIARLDSFIRQSRDDSTRSGRKPIVCWKRSRKPWLAMLRCYDLDHYQYDCRYVVCYRDWVIVPLETLLEVTPDHFWFWGGPDHET